MVARAGTERGGLRPEKRGGMISSDGNSSLMGSMKCSQVSQMLSSGQSLQASGASGDGGVRVCGCSLLLVDEVVIEVVVGKDIDGVGAEFSGSVVEVLEVGDG
jgi:hypothetical protein